MIIPTNQPCIRDDREDVIYKSMQGKIQRHSGGNKRVSAQGRPFWSARSALKKARRFRRRLRRKFGIEHEVLNAKQHAREAVIVAKAGQQHQARDGSMRGNVTIATNMAGRGTDIKLGAGVADIGGLHILGTERHEASRIDNQLRGRAGSQGDAGSSQFFLSFDDDLMRIFAPEWTVKALSWIGWEEGEPIYHPRSARASKRRRKKSKNETSRPKKPARIR